MKEKIKIFGIGNEERFNHYTFEKTKKAHEILSEIFLKVLNVRWETMEEKWVNDNPTWVPLDIGKCKDFHQVISGIKSRMKIEGVRIDIFYGEDKMFITIHCSLGRRREVHKRLREISEFPKPRKTVNQKIKENGNNKKTS